MYRRILVLIAFVLVVVAVGIGARHYPDWKWIVEREQLFRAQVTVAPIESWCVGVSLYFMMSLIPGTGGKSVIAGWLFGFWAALAMIELGLTAAAVVSFSLSRYLFGEFVRHRWKNRLRFLDRRFTDNGAFTLLILRFAHAPFTLVNYGAGAAKVPLRTFWWTTHVGILPGSIVFAFVGSRIPSLQAVVDRGVWSLVDWPLTAALLGTIVLSLILSRTRYVKTCRLARFMGAGTSLQIPSAEPRCESRND